MSTPHPAAASSDIERYIGTHVAALRASRNLTQEQLADATGVTKGYVSKIENGHIVPPIGTLVKIALALQVEITEFLKASGDGYDDAMSIVPVNERRPVVRGASAFGSDYVSRARKNRHKDMEPSRAPFPTAITTRPQLASSPASAVFTSGEFPIESAILRAEASDSAPITSISTNFVNPSPSRATCWASSRQRSESAA